jgi:hypothetical protein
LMANTWAAARLVPAPPAAFREIANRFITDRSVPSQAIPLRSLGGPRSPTRRSPLLDHHSIDRPPLIASVPNRFPTNPLQAIQLMEGSLTPDRPPAAGLKPGLASAVRPGRGQQGAAGRLADPSSGVQP